MSEHERCKISSHPTRNKIMIKKTFSLVLQKPFEGSEKLMTFSYLACQWAFAKWFYNVSTFYLYTMGLSHPNHGAVYMIRSYPWKADVKPQTVHKLNNQCYLWGVILNHTQLCVIYFTNYQASFVYLFCTKLTSALLINII